MSVRDIVSWNFKIDGYARIGNIFAAREFFKRMSDRNLRSWNVMLALYVRSKYYGECLRLFDKMIGEGDVKPDEATLVSILIACGSLGVLDRSYKPSKL
ncbi:hypothetical protein GIB67_022857 [Kingdonia uniflora]|uniref:Pentatricopeptide repeat-containing protein n=1 Tax=Kingdonia uniflora TaxID=39325 RepID=A0A7J7P6W3_9MAGN|nr:hypothetical protein GIB67_022857 [Kingdonia uniflora]